MTRDELVEDLSYVRAMAEEGRHAPLVGGSFLVLFGVLLAGAYTTQWALITGQFGPPQGAWFAMLWAGFGVSATIGATLLRQRVRTMSGASTLANRVDRTLWQAVGAAMIAVVLGAVLRGILKHDWLAPNVIMAVGFGVYGVALSTTAMLSESGWLRPFALISFLCSAVLWFYLDAPWTYLLAALAAVVVLVAPGVAMLRREPSATV